MKLLILVELCLPLRMSLKSFHPDHLLHASTRFRIVSAPPPPDDTSALSVSPALPPAFLHLRATTCVPRRAYLVLRASTCVARPACIHLRTSTCVPPRGATLKLHLHLRTSLSSLSLSLSALRSS